MKNEKQDKYEPVADVEGRIRDLPARSPQEYDEEALKILRSIDIKEYPERDTESMKPYFAEDLICQYDFFRKNIYNPRRVFYPCCNLDVSPIRGFPDSEVVLMDNEEGLEEIMRREGIRQFIQGNVLSYNPSTPFDLVIALNPTLPSSDLTSHLSIGGYVLANNWHDNSSELLEDPSFEGIGTIDRNENGIYLARGDFSKMEPGQFETYFYVFKKSAE